MPSGLFQAVLLQASGHLHSGELWGGGVGLCVLSFCNTAKLLSQSMLYQGELRVCLEEATSLYKKEIGTVWRQLGASSSAFLRGAGSGVKQQVLESILHPREPPCAHPQNPNEGAPSECARTAPQPHQVEVTKDHPFTKWEAHCMATTLLDLQGAALNTWLLLLHKACLPGAPSLCCELRLLWLIQETVP